MGKKKLDNTAVIDKPESIAPESKKEKKAKDVTLTTVNGVVDSTPKSQLIGLPKEILNRKIKGNSTVSPGTQDVTLAQITGTSKCIYVNNIHDANPIVLEVHYWANMHGQRWPIGRITEEEHEFILQHAGLPPKAHITTVVDCSIDPTLSYAWYADQMQGRKLPTFQMVLDYEAKNFGGNTTNFYNQRVQVQIRGKKKDEDEEAWTFDDDEVASTEEEAWTFSDDE